MRSSEMARMLALTASLCSTGMEEFMDGKLRAVVDLRRMVDRIEVKSRGSFGGEVLEIVHGGEAIKDSSFELFGLDGFENLLEAWSGAEA